VARLAPSLGLALVLLLAGSARGEEPATLRVAGSATLAPVLAAWSGVLSREDPPLRVEIASGGSSTGPHALLTGAADVASMSRPLTEDELAAFTLRFGSPPSAIAVAVDAIAVFVHPDNPIPGLDLGAIDAIFAARPGCSDRARARTWGDVGAGGDWAGRTISVFGRDPASGTRAVFQRLALCGAPFTPALRERPGPRSTILSVAESRFAVGYGSRAEVVVEGGDAVRVVPVSDGRGGPFEMPEAAAVEAGRYPLGRHLWLVAVPGSNGPDPRVDRLVRFALSEPGQASVSDAGFWPLTVERRRAELDELAGAP